VPFAVALRTPDRAVEPVCGCEDTNPFAMPPMPFAKFLERENFIATFQQRPAPPFPLIYGPTHPTPALKDDSNLGRHIDLLA
jgi:hypothetical protein